MKTVAVPQTKLHTSGGKNLPRTEAFPTMKKIVYRQLLFIQNAYRTMYSPTKTGKAECCQFSLPISGIPASEVDDICTYVHTTSTTICKYIKQNHSRAFVRSAV